MKRNALHAALIILFCLLSPGPAAAADDVAANHAAKDAAQKASTTWLNLVDEGEYAESWKEAAAYFRGAVGEEQWKESLAGHRKPLGKVLSRKRSGSGPTRRRCRAPPTASTWSSFTTPPSKIKNQQWRPSHK